MEITLPETQTKRFQNPVLRSIRQFPHLGPANTSAEAFVSWMQANGGAGEHLQGDLYAAYKLLCNGSEWLPISEKKFGREMERVGCVRKPMDINDGKRSKPLSITIPAAGETGSVESKIASRLSALKGSGKRSKTRKVCLKTSRVA